MALKLGVCQAQPASPVELTWEAPKNCPQQPEVQQELRALLGDSSNESTNPFVARGTIEAFAGHYRLTLLIERRATHGARVIESDDCTSLAKAATVVLGLLVQKERTLGRELSESELSGQPEQPQLKATPLPPKPTEVSKPNPSPHVEEPPRPLQYLLRAPQGSIDLSTLPETGYGIGLGVGIAYHLWRALVSAKYFPIERVSSTVSSQYKVEYGRKSIETLGCYGLRSGIVEVAPCVLIEANDVSAHAVGSRLTSKDTTALWVSVGGGIAGFLHVHRRLALMVMGSGRLTTDRPRFLVGGPAGEEQAYQVPLATVDVSAACEWSF